MTRPLLATATLALVLAGCAKDPIQEELIHHATLRADGYAPVIEHEAADHLATAIDEDDIEEFVDDTFLSTNKPDGYVDPGTPRRKRRACADPH
jgi:hypothetical protein